MFEHHVILEEIDMGQNMIEYHDIQPVRIVVVVERYTRACVDLIVHPDDVFRTVPEDFEIVGPFTVDDNLFYHFLIA